jgi:hypothetical protein
LAFFGKKPEKTGLAGMAHPPYGTNFLKRDGFLALNFSMARIFDLRPPRVVESLLRATDFLHWRRPLVKNSGHRKSREAGFALALGAPPLPEQGEA